MLNIFKKKNHENQLDVSRATAWKEGIMPSFFDKQSIIYSPPKNKLVVLLLSVAILFSLLLLKLSQLQIFQSRYYQVLAEANRIVAQIVPYERGLIFDRAGKVIAQNTPSFRATIVYSQAPLDNVDAFSAWQQEVKKLFNLTDSEFFDVIDQARQTPFVELSIQSNLSQETVLQYEALEQKPQGLYIRPDFRREYPYENIFSHLIGYTGEISREELEESFYRDYIMSEHVGKEGIEATFQLMLKGSYGENFVEVDSEGNTSRIISSKEQLPGSSLYLTVDAELQQKSHELLIKAMEKYQATGGVVIIQRVNSGAILALSSLPTYDNRTFAQGISPQDYTALIEDSSHPLFNRAIAGVYPPGSTVKPFVGLAALEENIISSFTLITDTPQVIEVGGGRFPDWRVSWGRGPVGPMTIKDAIAESSNIFFYKISGGYEQIEGLGIERIKKYLSQFGIGKRTGIDLPGESTGVFPDHAWKLATKNENWYLGDDYQVGIGQGDLLVTPIQMVNAVTTLANGGRVYKPQLVEKIVNNQGKDIEVLLPEVLQELHFDQSYMRTIREGMRQAVSEGIVFSLRNTKVPVAAKTGTAEFGEVNKEGGYETHAWVEGFAPYENPEISFVVLLEKGGSSSNAAEVGKELIDWYFRDRE